MINADIELTAGFNRGLAALIHDAGLNAKTVVAKESGELIKTLVRMSPKADAKKIKDDITRRFELQNFEVKSDLAGKGKTYKQGIEWIGVNSHYLTGIAPDKDMREASPEDLKKFLYQITKKGRIRSDFKHPRARQRILILQRVLTKTKTVITLAGMKAKNRGRLAAGWLVATTKGPIKLTGANLPPKFVTDHARGARGNFINGLEAVKFPNFTLINTAKGIGHKSIDRMLKTAIGIRTKAMEANTLLFMKGKKFVSDYK